MIHRDLIKDLERIGVKVLDVTEDYVVVSAENTYDLEYYPPFQPDPYVSQELQDVMDENGYYLEWYNAGIAHINLDYDGIYR